MVRAWCGRPARIELQVRRLYCENPLCPKATFAEQVDGLTVRYRRRTPMLQRLVEIAGVMLAGRGGARLLRLLYAGLSRASVLSHLMKIPLPAPTEPRGAGRRRLRSVRPYLRHAVGRRGNPAPDHLVARPRRRNASGLAARASGRADRLPGRLTDLPPGHHQWPPDAIQVSDRLHLCQVLSRRVQQIAAVHSGRLAAAAPEPDLGPARRAPARASYHQGAVTGRCSRRSGPDPRWT
jgi:hypothetical protein